MPRTCLHMPGAAKEVDCPLCKDIEKHGKPVTKHALSVLNNQQPKAPTRVCSLCNQEVPHLVTREGRVMCDVCARTLDEEEELGYRD